MISVNVRKTLGKFAYIRKFFFSFNLPVSYTVSIANSISLVNWKAQAMVHYVMSTFGAFNKMSLETVAVFIAMLRTKCVVFLLVNSMQMNFSFAF